MMRKMFALIGALLISAVFVSTASAESHTIKKGETLKDITDRYDITVESLLELNEMTKEEAKEGFVLKLPSHITNTADYKPKVKKVAATAKQPKTYKMVATAYTANCNGCTGITKTGLNLKKNPYVKVVSVDPRVIPLGSNVWVEGYGNAVAADTGGAIKGNKIDIFVTKRSTAYQWGRRTVTVKVY